MKPLFAALSGLALLPMVLQAADQPAASYTFQLDGKPFQPTVFSLNATPGSPQPGDVIRVGDFLLTLGAEKNLRFRSTPREDGRLLLVRKDDGVDVVGVRIGWKYQGDNKVLVNPLDNLSAEEIRGLRSVYLEVWNEQIGQRLQQINAKQTCITLTDHTAQGAGKALPPLPAALEYLCVDEHSNDGLRDYTRLGELVALRFLRLRAWTVAVDLVHLKRTVGLRYLDLTGSHVKNASALASLKEVRFLGLAYAQGVDSVDFAAGMNSLVEVDAQQTTVADLAPLGGKPALAAINANLTPVRKLPDKPLPALRRLAILSTPLEEKAVKEFAAAHPQCKVQFRWTQSLRDELTGITRVRVRSGGTCHRDLAREKTLIEANDAAVIARLIDTIRITEQGSGFHCKCCGDPSFEFFKGDRLVVTLGFHHGHGVRWVDGWPADGALSEEGADSLCQWLADRGYPQPLQARQEEKKRTAVARRRNEQYTALIPAKVVDGLRQAESAEAAVRAFQDGVPDAKARTELYLKLFGVTGGSWNHYGGLDELLKESLLPAVKKEILAAVLAKAKDGGALEGASRWLIGEDQWKLLEPATLNEVLPVVAAHSLGHPRAHNRRQALAVLGQVSSTGTLPLLRSALAGEIKVRKLAADEEAEAGGTVVARPGDLEMTKGSDRAYAAMMLAKRKDTMSLETIRKLAQNAAGDDRTVLQQALDLLEKKP